MTRRRLVLEEIDHEHERYLVLGFDAPQLDCFATLSRSELAVISLWLEGLSTRTIAGRRNASVRTVANQVNSAYRKMRVSSRAELLALVHGRRVRPLLSSRIVVRVSPEESVS